MKRKLDRPVLAEGEVTGHAHVLDSDEVAVYDIGDGMREWEAKIKIPLRHEEHEVIELPPSPTKEYISGRIQEWDEFEQAAKNVQD